MADESLASSGAPALVSAEYTPETYNEYYREVASALFRHNTSGKQEINSLEGYLSTHHMWFIFCPRKRSAYQKHFKKHIGKPNNNQKDSIEDALLRIRKQRPKGSTVPLEVAVQEAYALDDPFERSATIVLAYELKYITISPIGGSLLEQEVIADTITSLEEQKKQRALPVSLSYITNGTFDFDAAITDCNQKIAVNPKDPKNYVALLRILLEKNKGTLEGGEKEYAKYTLYHLGQLDVRAACALAEQYLRRFEEKKAMFILTKLYEDGIQHTPLYNLLLEVLEQEKHLDPRPNQATLIEKIKGEQTELDFAQRIKHYQSLIEANYMVPESYLGIVETVLQKSQGTPSGHEREYAHYALFKVRELGAEARVIQLAKTYCRDNRYADAGFVLAKLVEDGTEHPQAYTTLARAVRAQNTTRDPAREQWAHFLDWKASTLPNRE
ncbi:MAG: hypothetical protein AABX82_08600 [Nanoarchaeota archaeon]